MEKELNDVDSMDEKLAGQLKEAAKMAKSAKRSIEGKMKKKRNVDDVDCLADAIENNDPALLEQLLESFRGDINESCDSHGSTLLHYACLMDSNRMIAMLEDAGADPTIDDVHGCVPDEYRNYD